MPYRHFTRRALWTGAVGASGAFVYSASHNNLVGDNLNAVIEDPESSKSTLSKINATSPIRRNVQIVAPFFFGKKTFTKAEVAAHNKKSTGIWVSKGDQVYDISEFVDQHPGGAKILLAAGKSIDPFWNHYRQHQNATVEGMLDQYHIGTLSDYDPVKDAVTELKSPYLNDPDRSSDLRFHSIEPCNAEAPLEDEDDNAGPVEYITPNELFFVRNHHPVPDLKPETHKVNIQGKATLSVADLKAKYKERNVTTTIQCGGNRRNELNKYGKTSGTPWCGGAISTAKWTGVALRDVLLDIDPSIMNEENRSGKWVTLRSVDNLEVSIPVEKALNPNGDVMLAYKMNGDDIPRDHGYPLRVIVPGFVGVRNVKWVSSIELTDNEVESPWQTGMAYKMLAHYSKTVTKEELASLKTTQESPIQSFITTKPAALKETLAENGKANIFGVAWSGGGRGIQRVEVSLDGGESWQAAQRMRGVEQNPYKAWAWTMWKLEVTAEDMKNSNSIRCRATDISYNTQPERTNLVWNIRGINNNSWHTVSLTE